MMMKERIKSWIKKVFLMKYIIVRNEFVLWHLMYAYHTQTKYVLASSEMLTKVGVYDGFTFSTKMRKAYQTNAFWSWVLIKILIYRNGEKYKFKRIKAKNLVFLTDLTGLTEN
jgi:hypothetical protein